MKVHESMFTHILPGIILGGSVIALLFLHNIAAALFDNLPILLSLGVFLFGLIWLIHSVMYKVGAKSVPAILAVVGAIFFIITWSFNHYVPNSCAAHGGFLSSSTSHHSDETVVHIICKDGYTFGDVQ